MDTLKRTLIETRKRLEISTLGTLLNYYNRVVSVFGYNLIGFWPLDDASGTSARDLSVNNFPIIYKNTVSLNQPALFGKKGAKFSGSGAMNFYTEDIASKFDGQEGFFSMYVKANSASDWYGFAKYLFGISIDASNAFFIRNTAGDLFWYAYYNAGGTVKSLVFSCPNSTKGFYIGIKWSKTDDIFAVYINGTQLRSIDGVGTFTGSLNTNSHVFASGTYTGRFLGTGQAICLMNVAPSDSDILRTVNPRGLFMFAGDSRTAAGCWHGIAAEATTFNSELAFGGYGIIQEAVSGSTVADLADRIAVTNSKQLSGKTNVICVWIGVNSAAIGAQAIYDSIKSTCLAYRAAGWDKIVLCTEIDAIYLGWHDDVHNQLNDLIYADSSFADVVADLGADVRLQDANDTTYYNADKIHLTSAGYTVVGTIVNTAISSLGLT